MRIVVTTQGTDLDSTVDPRFGRASRFLLVDTETMQSTAHDNVRNLNAPQGAGIQAAQAVYQLGAARSSLAVSAPRHLPRYAPQALPSISCLGDHSRGHRAVSRGSTDTGGRRGRRRALGVTRCRRCPLTEETGNVPFRILNCESWACFAHGHKPPQDNYESTSGKNKDRLSNHERV